MSTGPGPRGNRRLLAGMAIVVVSVLLLWDLHAHQVTTLFAGPARTRQAGEPLQLEGMPILRPGTLTLGEGNPTVAVAASCAFLTPIGHQNNMLIMGPGGYHFSDYWRMGLPLEILIIIITLPMILWVWPL